MVNSSIFYHPERSRIRLYHWSTQSLQYIQLNYTIAKVGGFKLAQHGLVESSGERNLAMAVNDRVFMVKGRLPEGRTIFGS
jgi:hypothetical protein